MITYCIVQSNHTKAYLRRKGIQLSPANCQPETFALEIIYVNKMDVVLQSGKFASVSML